MLSNRKLQIRNVNLMVKSCEGVVGETFGSGKVELLQILIPSIDTENDLELIKDSKIAF